MARFYPMARKEEIIDIVIPAILTYLSGMTQPDQVLVRCYIQPFTFLMIYVDDVIVVEVIYRRLTVSETDRISAWSLFKGCHRRG